MFDGVGSSAYIVKQLTSGISLHLVWETDPECISVAQHHHPEALRRGDFLQDDAEAIAQLIKDHDPSGSMIILFVAAPPCPDFSRILEDAPGAQGEEGQKFTKYCAFANQIEMRLPHTRVGHLVENVVMQKTDSAFFGSRLDAHPVLCDSTDLGLINRPRLWWTRIAWSQLRRSPMTGLPLRWSKLNKHHKLHLDGPLHEAKDIDTGDQWLNDRASAHEARVPCFATPSPDEGGRPAPKRMKGRISPEQKMRWLNDGRTFAPWQYADEALMTNHDGSKSVPSADIKEQLHQLPKGYTGVTNVPTRSRHRMIANGWHIGAAKFLFMLVLQSVMLAPKACIAPTPNMTALQQMMLILEQFPAEVGPGSWRQQPSCTPRMPDMWQRWEHSITAPHPLQRQPHLEPGLQQCLDIQQLIGGSLSRMRKEIVDEITKMVHDKSLDTETWWTSLEPHIARVYWDEEHQQISQIPLFIQLMKQLRMPLVDQLADDLSTGFNVTGHMNPGAGWLPRTDDRYSHPITSEAFRKHNAHYTAAKLTKYRVDPEWQTMLTELTKEFNKGRMSGPYSSPRHWSKTAVPVQGHELQPICLLLLLFLSATN